MATCIEVHHEEEHPPRIQGSERSLLFKFTVRSTAGHDIDIEVCSLCHPFFTGKQKIVDTGGRVEAFKKRFGMLGAQKQ